MIGMDILKPVVALAAWTMVMWLWMYATRLPAMTNQDDLCPLLPSRWSARAAPAS